MEDSVATVRSGERVMSLSADPVFAAFGADPQLHSLYMVYRLLEMRSGTGVVVDTNRELADQLGLSRSHVQRMVRTLERMGLIYPQVAFDQTRSIVVPQPNRRMVLALEAIRKGSLVVDVKAARIYGKESGNDFIPDTLHPPECTPCTPQSVGPTLPRVQDLHSPECTPLHSPEYRSPVSEGPSSTSGQSCEVELDSSVVCSNSVQVVGRTVLQTTTDIAKESSSPEPDHGGDRKGSGRKSLPVTPEMKAVHEGWLQHTKPKMRTPLRSGMASSIRARLTDGFSVEDLILVAEWAANDPWMSGKHEKNKQPYLGVGTLYRSTDKTAGYLQRAEAWAKAGKQKNGGVYDRKALHLSSAAPVTSVEWF